MYALLLKAEVLRLGHNIDVPNAALECERICKGVLEQQPDTYQAHCLLGSLYVASNSDMAAVAEHHFREAQRLPEDTLDARVLQGLGFALVYQEKFQEAIDFFDAYLRICKEDTSIQELVGHLKAGDRPTFHCFPSPG